MGLNLAYAFIFLSAALFVYAALTGFYPQIRGVIQANYLEVDEALKRIFYTDNDAKLFVGLRYFGSLVLFLVGFLLLNSLVFGLLMAAILYWIPSLLLERILRKRSETLEEQTSDVMTAMTACIRSGMTLEESISEVATALRAPVSQEFALIKQRIDAGQTISSSLRAADKRLQLPRLSLVFQSIIVSQERGGNLASLMSNLSESTREIERVEERVKTETAGLRLSSQIMACMPPVLLVLLYFADPAQVTMLFTTVIGNIFLALAILLDIAAFRIMQKIIDLDT